MRKFVVVLMATLMMAAALPVIAADTQTPPPASEKDQCLLYSKNCATQVDTLQKRVKKLNDEIQKGTRVYSPQELKRLNEKLKEAQDIMNNLEQE